MLDVALQVDFHQPLLAVDTDLGRCVVAATSWPFDCFLPRTFTYVVLGDWLPPSAPVGMFVTARAYKDETNPQLVRGVHMAYATNGMRGGIGRGPSAPVVVGRRLFDLGLLTHHSPDRTAAGDRWAHKVGGCVPRRDQMGTPEDAERDGQAGVARLNQMSWPAEVLVALAGDAELDPPLVAAFVSKYE